MKKQPWMIGVAAFVLLGLAAWWIFNRGGAREEEKEPEPVAQIKVAALHHGTIQRMLAVYGTAVAPAGGARTISFPFECRVATVLTNPGQPVAKGDALLQIEPSADAQLALESARGAEAAAKLALQDVRQRFQSHLATNQDMVAAEGAAHDAQLKLQSLEDRQPPADGLVRAPSGGIVTRVLAQPGAITPAGSLLVEIAVENRLEAKLGVAPPDAGEIKPGQAVHLSPVEPGHEEASPPVTGHVRTVGQSIDPTTRLVDAFVTLDGEAPLLLGSFVRASIVVESKECLLAPREAVLPEADGKTGVLFTVEDGHAVKHKVRTGIDDGRNIEVAGGDYKLSESTPVATEGAYELEDGMAVQINREEPSKP